MSATDSTDPLPIQFEGERNYYEGDSLWIPFELIEEFADPYEPYSEPEDPIPIDLTSATATFLVKEERTDRDSDALLEKTSDGSGSDDTATDGDIEILQPPEDGRLRVQIRTGDTDGFLDSTDENGDQTRLKSKTFRWVLRVTDGSGNRVSSELGTWEINAS